LPAVLLFRGSLHQEDLMDVSRAVATMKGRADFAEKVGVVLVHIDLVRACPRPDEKKVVGLEIIPDKDKIEAIREDFLRRPGIFDIVVEAKAGRFQPGHDLLFLMVSGDCRENVQPVLTELFSRIKEEAVIKKEITG
jgi:molybdopterin synthase catalytic subunit